MRVTGVITEVRRTAKAGRYLIKLDDGNLYHLQERDSAAGAVLAGMIGARMSLQVNERGTILGLGKGKPPAPAKRGGRGRTVGG